MSSLNLNKVVLVGRLTATPELKQTINGVTVCNFTLAVNRKWQGSASGAPAKPQADFISIIAWRQTAEFIKRYFDKGSCICIVGGIQTRTWEDAKGEKRYATDVVAEEAMFVDNKTADIPNQDFKPHVEPKFEEVDTNGDLPF